MLFIFKINLALAYPHVNVKINHESSFLHYCCVCPFKTPSFQLIFKAASHESIVAIPEYIAESLYANKNSAFWNLHTFWCCFVMF